ncbi:hypothetical protein KY285_024241 [Solanum tuberosum]|nr:hypothetical protein KY289_024577 [Solanum tuberosum]KAH0673230.1 hypothetical protein KY284_024317 [Solanum tuberosum]KAH0676440.1 hypothetical protein KY285_024241 [Solanum tuberosum]
MLLGLFKSIGAPCWIILKDSTFGGFEVRFSKENILGAGGYGMVYHGNLINGTLVDINKFLNNLSLSQRKSFKWRLKPLVSLLGYCIEGMHSITTRCWFTSMSTMEIWNSDFMEPYDTTYISLGRLG